jgi:hypothetical protein
MSFIWLNNRGKAAKKKGCGEVSGRQDAYNRYVVAATSLEEAGAGRQVRAARAYSLFLHYNIFSMYTASLFGLL